MENQQNNKRRFDEMSDYDNNHENRHSNSTEHPTNIEESPNKKVTYNSHSTNNEVKSVENEKNKLDNVNSGKTANTTPIINPMNNIECGTSIEIGMRNINRNSRTF